MFEWGYTDICTFDRHFEFFRPQPTWLPPWWSLPGTQKEYPVQGSYNKFSSRKFFPLRGLDWYTSMWGEDVFWWSIQYSLPLNLFWLNKQYCITFSEIGLPQIKQTLIPFISMFSLVKVFSCCNSLFDLFFLTDSKAFTKWFLFHNWTLLDWANSNADFVKKLLVTTIASVQPYLPLAATTSYSAFMPILLLCRLAWITVLIPFFVVIRSDP